MSKQFELTRGALMRFVKELNEEIVDVQPAGFNNTIRWHIGHVLATAESFMFGYPKKSTNIPESYKDLFGMGSKPSDWDTNIPTLQELTSYLEQQSERIAGLSSDFLAQKLPFEFPFGNIQTYADLYALMLYHEADHLGQMKAMKRIIQA